MTIAHDGLPVEWLTDMKAWWTLQLSMVDWHLRNR